MYRSAPWLWLLVLSLAGCTLLPSAPAPTAAPPPPTVTVVPALATAAPRQPASTAQPAAVPDAASGPLRVSGSFSYSNDFIFTYYVENAVALVDMHGFITRDQEWRLPIESQVLGYMELDADAKTGTFRLALPARPEGLLHDLDNDGQQEQGVQVFAIAWWPNLTGGPFWEKDENDLGWPSYLASTVNDTENHDEVIGGKLIVWAPDDQQQFPTGFGPDKLLFTSDDPAGTIPAGYALIDLDQQPFAVSREPELELTIYEPADRALKDFSDLGYRAAFDKLFEQVRREYAFNGIAGKEPDWDTVYAQLAPQVDAAERSNDQRGFYLALQAFSNAFQDGHVGLNGPAGAQVFRQQAGGGYGLTLRELDDGNALVVFVGQGSPAANAGIKVGALVSAVNNLPVGAAIAQVVPFEGPHSTEHARRYQQTRYLTRAPVGTRASFSFSNPGEAQQTVELQAVGEFASLLTTTPDAGTRDDLLPVTFQRLESGVGYIKISSFYDDLNLLVRLFERALRTFEAEEVPGVIIDLRQNGGGSSLGLASYLIDTPIAMGQRQYYSDKSGKFEPDGPARTIEPAATRYRFDKLALLVGPACASACESAAYGFSQVPGMLVFGQSPTAGMYGEVSRGQFELPDGISMQVPTGRSVLADGTIFLEGTGVVPTTRVPVTRETVLNLDDAVLQAAEQAIGGR